MIFLVNEETRSEQQEGQQEHVPQGLHSSHQEAGADWWWSWSQVCCQHHLQGQEGWQEGSLQVQSRGADQKG